MIYLTAHADEDTLTRAKVTEPFGYIVKPIGNGNLTGSIEMALYKHRMERQLEAAASAAEHDSADRAGSRHCRRLRGKVQFMNSAAEQLTGWTPAAFTGQLLTPSLPCTDAARVRHNTS